MSQVSTTTSTYMLTKFARQDLNPNGQGASTTLSWSFFDRPHLIVKIHRTTTTPGPYSEALAKLGGARLGQQNASSMRLEVEWQVENIGSSQTQGGESPFTVICLQTLDFDAQARMLANALPRSELPLKATFQDDIVGFRFLDTSLPATSPYRRFQVKFPNRADMFRFLGEIENVCPCAETTIAPVPPTTLTASVKEKNTGGPLQVQGPTTEKPAPTTTSAPIPSTTAAPVQAQFPASAPMSFEKVAPLRAPDLEVETVHSPSLEAVTNAEQTPDDIPGAVSGSNESKLPETAAASSTRTAAGASTAAATNDDDQTAPQTKKKGKAKAKPPTTSVQQDSPDATPAEATARAEDAPFKAKAKTTTKAPAKPRAKPKPRADRFAEAGTQTDANCAPASGPVDAAAPPLVPSENQLPADTYMAASSAVTGHATATQLALDTCAPGPIAQHDAALLQGLDLPSLEEARARLRWISQDDLQAAFQELLSSLTVGHIAIERLAMGFNIR